MRRAVIAAAVAGLLALLATPLYAGGGKVGNVQPGVGGSFSDGPYAAATPDSGTCGDNWAVDLFNRKFVIKPQNPDGSWTVVQRFANGRFISLGDGQSGPAPSPGACNTSPGPGGNGNTLKEGVSGAFTGSFTITVQPGFSFVGNGGCGTLSDWPANAGSGSVPGDCTTKGWVETHFPGAVYGSTATVTAFSLTYTAKINNVNKHWTNSDAGNTGDICTSGSC